MFSGSRELLDSNNQHHSASCLSHIGTEAQVLAYSLHQLQVLLGPLLHLTVEVYAPGAFQFQDDLTGNQIQG